MIAFFTGATGFIGQELLKALSSKYEKIYVLTREQSAIGKVRAISALKNVIVVKGVLERTDFNLNDELIHKIKSEVTDFIHLAAIYDLRVSREDAYQANIIGTQNCIDFANSCLNINIFHYFSTYVVNTGSHKIVPEEYLDLDLRFDNFYAYSKNRAEHLVRNNFHGKYIRIYRPGMVIGHSLNAVKVKKDGPYLLINFFKKFKSIAVFSNRNILLPLAFNKYAQLPFIPVDYLVAWCSEMITNPVRLSDRIRTYHLFYHPIPLKDFFDLINEKIKLKITFVNVFLSSFVVKKVLQLVGLPQQISSYLTSPTMYELQHLKMDYPSLPKYGLPEIIRALFGEQT